jgi:hypothetical protein
MAFRLTLRVALLLLVLALGFSTVARADAISLEFTANGPTTVALGDPFEFFAGLRFMTEPASSTQTFPQTPVFEPDPELGEQRWVAAVTETVLHGLDDVRFSLNSPELGFLGSRTVDAQRPVGPAPVPNVIQLVGESWQVFAATPGFYEITLSTTLLGDTWTDTTTIFRTRLCHAQGCTDWGAVDQETTTNVTPWSQSLASQSLTFRVIDSVQAVPESGTLWLFCAGLLGLCRLRCHIPATRWQGDAARG